MGEDIGPLDSVACDVGGPDWRYAERKEAPEDAPLNTAALRRRLERPKGGSLHMSPGVCKPGLAYIPDKKVYIAYIALE